MSKFTLPQGCQLQWVAERPADKFDSGGHQAAALSSKRATTYLAFARRVGGRAGEYQQSVGLRAGWLASASASTGASRAARRRLGAARPSSAWPEYQARSHVPNTLAHVGWRRRPLEKRTKEWPPPPPPTRLADSEAPLDELDGGESLSSASVGRRPTVFFGQAISSDGPTEWSGG